jgi:hypothetical protein
MTVHVLYELVGLVAVSGAILLTGLILRNPLGPQILQTDFAAQSAGLVLTAAVLVLAIYAHQGFVAAGLDATAAAAAVVGVIAASVTLFWKAFRVGERLKRADEGRSPFGRLRDATQSGQPPIHLTGDPPTVR